MATEGGPSTTTDGLILNLDVANPKSYPGSGTTWTDTISGFDSSLVNGPTNSTSGKGSLIFDGTNDYCQITSNGTGTFNNQSWTIESWVRPHVTTKDGAIFSYDYTAHSPPYYATQFRLMNSGRIYLSWNNNGSWTSNVTSFSTPNDTYVANEWQHIVGLFTSGRQEIRLNGEIVDSDNKAHTITYYSQEVWVGRANYSSGYLDGNIGMVKYYNRALSGDEIIQNYNATKHRFK